VGHGAGPAAGGLVGEHHRPGWRGRPGVGACRSPGREDGGLCATDVCLQLSDV